MFIERSVARIRGARVLFVLVCLLPCLALVACAAWLKSDRRRDAVRARWQEVIGLPLAIESVEQPRPGVVRGRRCAILAPDGRRLVEMPTVELESSAAEDRVRIDVFRCDPAVAAVLAALGREWLGRDVRFPRNCVVEVADFAWSAADVLEPVADRSAIAGLRLECVAHEGSRAIRVVRRGDEARVVRTAPSADSPGETLVCEAAWRDPIPLGVLAEFFGGGGSATAAGGSATVTGTLDARATPAGASGTARARIDGVDLAAGARALGAQAAGRGTVAIERLEWQRGQVVAAVVSCEFGAGWLDGRLFDKFAVALGCRPGPASGLVAGERSFEMAGAVLSIGDDGLRISALPGMGGAIASARSGAVLLPPAGAVTVDRLAWLMAPPGTAFVPAEGPGAWLMSVFGRPPAEAPDGRSGRTGSTPSPGKSREF